MLYPSEKPRPKPSQFRIKIPLFGVDPLFRKETPKLVTSPPPSEEQKPYLTIFKLQTSDPKPNFFAYFACKFQPHWPPPPPPPTFVVSI